MDRKKGLYLGTEVEGKWWRRYREGNFFMRGNGEYWYDEQGFYFLRYLATKPVFVPFQAMLEVKLGKWHSGRWALGDLF